ncbi:hypothetical protein A2U01_0095331, partial [Trifolium medium]|nr:hypothetical protein [Trifolium medium]
QLYILAPALGAVQSSRPRWAQPPANHQLPAASIVPGAA